MSDLYEEAVREWVARQIRDRGHKDVTRDKIRNVRFGEDTPYGSDVTPPEDPAEAFVCELKVSDRKIGWWTDENGWMRHEEVIEYISPAELVAECLAIYEELKSEMATR